MLGKKADRLMGEGIPAFSLRPPFFIIINNGYQHSRGMRSKASICLCPDSLPRSLDGMSLLYFANSVCL